MNRLLRQFRSWRYHKIAAVSLVAVLLMAITYLLGENSAANDLVRNGTPVHNIQHTASDAKNIAGGDHKMKNYSILKVGQHAVVENIAGNDVSVMRSLTRKTKLPPLDEYWARILHFVPEEDSQDCLNLFTTASSRSTAITREWLKMMRSPLMADFSITPQHEKLTLTYQELARLKFVHTVCEIGFNVKQSAITWLTAKPDLKLYSFDIGGELQEKMAQVLKTLFPDRFKLIIGDSIKTVPVWVEEAIKCDIVVINGGSSYLKVTADIVNMQMTAAKQHILILDDIYFPHVNNAWKEKVKEDVVHHLFDCGIKGQNIDFALGHYKYFAGRTVNIQASLTRKTKLPPLNEYWARILHFVPEENSQDCLNLFTTESSRSITMAPQWEKLRGTANMSDFSSRLAPQHMKQTLTYQELARLKFVHTVCEIGFNVGQSAITWLTAKSDLKLYSFDLGGELQEKMGRALEKLFPDRFKLTVGDSTKTIPVWVEDGVKCDILFIDGGHTYEIVRADILNMQKAAAKQHIIIIDDFYFPDVYKAWNELVKTDVIHHLFDCWIKGQDIDFGLSYYKNVG